MFTDGGLLGDSAQAFSNVFLSQSMKIALLSYKYGDFVTFIVNVCEQTTNFFSLTRVLFGLLIFFPEIMLESWGCGLYTSAAYTRVFMVIIMIHNNNSNMIGNCPDYCNPQFHYDPHL